MLISHILTMGLLVLTFFFVWSTCVEYTKGETNTGLSTVPLTAGDNPTVTICFGDIMEDVEFKTDFTAKYRYWNGATHQTWDIDETMMRKLAVVDDSVRNCFLFYKVNKNIDRDKRINLDITFNDPTIGEEDDYDDEYYEYDDTEDKKAWVYITTEENAYGVINQRWFDGEVFKFYLNRFEEFSVMLDDVKEYKYLQSTCSDNSFYRCISKQMVHSNDCSEQEGLCEAVGLPHVFQACTSESAKNCTLKAFWRAYYNSTCKLEKVCSPMEYSSHSHTETVYNPNTMFSFGYGFTPGADQGRQIQPHKTVHTEYLVWSEFTLVAYIGGMLGLTVGISLLDIYFWVMDLSIKIVGKILSLRQKKVGGNQM